MTYRGRSLQASRFLIQDRLGRTDPGRAAEGARIIAELRAIRAETGEAVAARIKPSRTAEIMAWTYDSVEAALARAATRAGGASRR